MSDAPHAVVSAGVTNENPTPSFTANKIVDDRHLLAGAPAPIVLVTADDPIECPSTLRKTGFVDVRELSGEIPTQTKIPVRIATMKNGCQHTVGMTYQALEWTQRQWRLQP